MYVFFYNFRRKLLLMVVFKALHLSMIQFVNYTIFVKKVSKTFFSPFEVVVLFRLIFEVSENDKMIWLIKANLLSFLLQHKFIKSRQCDQAINGLPLWNKCVGPRGILSKCRKESSSLVCWLLNKSRRKQFRKKQTCQIL